MAQITIIMGSVYGAAEQLASQVQRLLLEQGYETIYNNAPGLADLQTSDAVLVITSTTGQGDLPSNLEPFYLDAMNSMPLLTGKPFGIIGLGDSSYQTFCGAAIKMEALFFQLQAHSPAATLKIDACETLEPETLALPWLKNWLACISL